MLSIVRSQEITKRRAGTLGNWEKVRDWCQAFIEFRNKVGATDRGTLVNFDESLLSYDKSRRLVVVPKGKHGSAEVQRGGACGCILPFVADDGTVLVVFVIIIIKVDVSANGKVARCIELPPTKETVPYQEIMLYTETGLLNKKVWMDLVAPTVHKLMRSRVRKLGSHVFLRDNLGAHVDLETDVELSRSGIFMWNLVPGSTMFLQALDSTPFAQFKMHANVFARDLDGATRSLGFTPQDTRLLVMRQAWRAALTRGNILSGFARTGTSPFNFAVSRAHCLAELGRATAPVQSRDVVRVNELIPKVMKANKEAAAEIYERYPRVKQRFHVEQAVRAKKMLPPIKKATKTSKKTGTPTKKPERLQLQRPGHGEWRSAGAPHLRHPSPAHLLSLMHHMQGQGAEAWWRREMGLLCALQYSPSM